MLRNLPMESVYEITQWFEKRFREERRAPESWKVLRLVFLKRPDARLEKGLRTPYDRAQRQVSTVGICRLY